MASGKSLKANRNFYCIPPATIGSRLAKLGLELDTSMHPSVAGEPVFEGTKHRGNVFGFTLRHDGLVWPKGTTPTIAGNASQFRGVKPTPIMKGDYARAVENTHGKPLANPEAANPFAVFQWAWHATRKGKPVIFIDKEHNEFNLAKLGNLQVAALEKIQAKARKHEKK